MVTQRTKVLESAAEPRRNGRFDFSGVLQDVHVDRLYQRRLAGVRVGPNSAISRKTLLDLEGRHRLLKDGAPRASIQVAEYSWCAGRDDDIGIDAVCED